MSTTAHHKQHTDRCVQMTVHIAKNYMSLPKIKVPLILGIWGGKGQGKTFQCMLSYKKLGINPIVMSAGALQPVCVLWLRS